MSQVAWCLTTHDVRFLDALSPTPGGSAKAGRSLLRVLGTRSAPSLAPIQAFQKQPMVSAHRGSPPRGRPFRGWKYFPMDMDWLTRGLQQAVSHQSFPEVERRGRLTNAHGAPLILKCQKFRHDRDHHEAAFWRKTALPSPQFPNDGEKRHHARLDTSSHAS